VGGGRAVEEETRKEGRKRVGNYYKAKEGSKRCAQQMQLSGQRRQLCVYMCVCVYVKFSVATAAAVS